MESFAEVADDDGCVSRVKFIAVFKQFLSPDIDRETRSRANLVLSRLFGVFDTNGDGRVDYSELVSGLTVLCGGERAGKVEAAFALYDYDNNGYIEFEEMVLYLTAVFRVLYSMQPGTQERMGVPPADLATATAQQCFAEADLNHDGRLSLDEFKLWYNKTSGSGAGNPVVTAANLKLPVTLEEAKAVSSLGSLAVDEVVRAFVAAADANGNLDRDAFLATLALLRARVPGSDDDDEVMAELVANRLFDLFDTNGNGSVDLPELAAGLAVLCGGSSADKVEASFRLFDMDGDGFITLGEMQAYLASMFRVVYAAEPDEAQRLGVSPDELAAATARECFREADINQDGKLSLQEFTAWTAGNGADSLSARVVSMSQAPISSSFQQVQQLTGLGSVRVNDVLELFAAAADDEGYVSRANFNRCFQALTAALPADTIAAGRSIIARLYDVFDEDGDGRLDYSEIMSGLTVLCAGSREDKARAAFTLYDVDGNGEIEFDEMVLFLSSAFKVIFETNPGVQDRMAVTPQQLAEITATQCFKEADIDLDGRLSLEDFTSWYERSADTALGASVVNAAELGASAMGARAANGEYDDEDDKDEEEGEREAITLEEMRKLTTLGDRTVDEAQAIFEPYVEGDSLSRSGFMAAFESIIPDLATNRRTAAMIMRLFDIFDADSK